MQYDRLAAVYHELVPEPLRTPEGAAAAFAEYVEGESVLDCACGTGELAVGLALTGRRVRGSDASPAMVERARALARDRGAGLELEVRRWEDLPDGEFDTVLCVGNSLAHAEDRVAALGGMRRAIRDGGRLVLTSRDWESPQPGEWEGNDLLVHGVRLTFFPFTRAELFADLDEAGFAVEQATSGERYVVVSRARGRGGRARRPCPPSP